MKKDEQMLEALRTVARNRDPWTDRRWEALAEGKLSHTEAGELRDAVQRSETMERMHEVFRPMDAQVDERLAAAVLGKLGHTDNVIPLHSPETTKPPAASINRRRGLIAAGVTLSLAAGVAVWLIPPTPPDPIAVYEIDLAGGDKRTMDPTPPDAELRLGYPESRLKVTLRPQTQVRGSIVVRGILVSGDHVREWSPPAQITSDGVVVIEGAKRDLFAGVPPGPWHLLVAVGRPEKLPEDPERLATLLRSLEPDPDKAFQVLHGRVLLSNGDTGN